MADRAVEETGRSGGWKAQELPMPMALMALTADVADRCSECVSKSSAGGNLPFIPQFILFGILSNVEMYDHSRPQGIAGADVIFLGPQAQQYCQIQPLTSLRPAHGWNSSEPPLISLRV